MVSVINQYFRNAAMSISKNTVETLLDLVEVKLSYMQVSDREDQRELAQLENCRRELRGLMAAVAPAKGRRALRFRFRGISLLESQCFPRWHIHAAPYRGAFANHVIPTLQMRRFRQVQPKPFVKRDPGERRDIRNRIVRPR